MTKNLVGMRFGMLTVVSSAGSRGRRKNMWNCLCDCGGTTVSEHSNLTGGNSKSCGCARRASFHKYLRERAEKSLWKKHPRSVNIWRGMMRRCRDPNNQDYDSYGGRGIDVCERWETLSNFIDDMGDAPPNLSLDRINNNAGYSPDNCRWATQTQQVRNRRNTVFAYFETETVCEFMPLIEISERLGIPVERMRKRIKYKHRAFVKEFEKQYFG